jgi:anion-transporting  ArsA/GET3 family ATPase
MTASLLDKRLVFVSGKGGVGKTTIAAALGLLAAARGKRVLVCDVEARGDLAAAYECGPTRYEAREVAKNLYAMSMDIEAALREYLHLHLRMPTAMRVGPVADAVELLATALPGVREVLTVGKLCYEVRENHYDLVIADAPATGNLVGQLAAPVGINDLVKVGAVRNQTSWMLDILRDPGKTCVWIATTPEEMPVNEAIDLANRLSSDTDVALGAVIANRVLPELFSRGEEEIFESLDTPENHERLEAAASRDRGEEAGAQVFHAARLAVQLRRHGAEHLARLRAALSDDVPIAYLPYLFGRTHGPRAIRQVAESLAEEIG